MLNPRTKNALYVLIFTAIAVVGAYFLITEINKMSEEGDQSILSDFRRNDRKDQSAMVDTKDWKTYRNEEYGFEFKYPSDYEAKIFDSQKDKNNTSFGISLKPNGWASPNLYVSMTVTNAMIEIFFKDTKFNFEEELKMAGIVKQGGIWEVKRDFDKGGKVEEIKNNNWQGVRADVPVRLYSRSNGIYFGEGKIIEVWISRGNVYALLRLNSVPSEKVFNQILSTFKFIE